LGREDGKVQGKVERWYKMCIVWDAGIPETITAIALTLCFVMDVLIFVKKYRWKGGKENV
jgi:hypothetical protein